MAKRHTHILIAHGLNVRRCTQVAHDAQARERQARQLRLERDALRRALARLARLSAQSHASQAVLDE